MKGVLRILRRLMDSMVWGSRLCMRSITSTAMSHKLLPRDRRLLNDSCPTHSRPCHFQLLHVPPLYVLLLMHSITRHSAGLKITDTPAHDWLPGSTVDNDKHASSWAFR